MSVKECDMIIWDFTLPSSSLTSECDIISEFSFHISLHGYAGIEILLEIILLNRMLVLQTYHEL